MFCFYNNCILKEFSNRYLTLLLGLPYKIWMCQWHKVLRQTLSTIEIGFKFVFERYKMGSVSESCMCTAQSYSCRLVKWKPTLLDLKHFLNQIKIFRIDSKCIRYLKVCRPQLYVPASLFSPTRALFSGPPRAAPFTAPHVLFSTPSRAGTLLHFTPIYSQKNSNKHSLN